MPEVTRSPYLHEVAARRLGESLAHHRMQTGETLEDVSARLEGAFDPTALAKIEAAHLPVTREDVDHLLDGYGIDPDSLLPDRQVLEFDDDRRSMAVGWTVWEMTRYESPEELLAEYLGFVYSMRGLEPGTPIPLRLADLEVLAANIAWSSDRIHEYLVDLMSEWRNPPAPESAVTSVSSGEQPESEERGSTLLARLRSAQSE